MTGIVRFHHVPAGRRPSQHARLSGTMALLLFCSCLILLSISNISCRTAKRSSQPTTYSHPLGSLDSLHDYDDLESTWTLMDLDEAESFEEEVDSWMEDLEDSSTEDDTSNNTPQADAFTVSTAASDLGSDADTDTQYILNSDAIAADASSSQTSQDSTFPASTRIGVPIIACIIGINCIFLFFICSYTLCSSTWGLSKKNIHQLRQLMTPELKQRLLDNVSFERRSIISKIRLNKGLTVSILIMLTYILICTAFYSVAQPEWGILSSLYFTVVTISTVGLGDFSPSHWYSKVFTICMIITGMLVLAYAVGLAASVFVHNQSERLTLALKSVSARTGRKKGILPFRARSITVFLQLSFAVLSFLTIWLLGSCIYFFFLEDWSFLDSMYFCITVLSSVGFGAIHSTNDASRLFTIVYVLFGTTTVAISIGIVSNLVLEFYQWSAMEKQRKKPLTLDSMHFFNGTKRCDRTEFLVWSLVRSGKVTEQQMTELIDLFNDLDVRRVGYLEPSQLKNIELPIELEDQD